MAINFFSWLASPTLGHCAQVSITFAGLVLFAVAIDWLLKAVEGKHRTSRPLLVMFHSFALLLVASDLLLLLLDIWSEISRRFPPMA